MKDWLAILADDIRANRGSPKGLFVVTFYRVASAMRRWPRGLWIVALPVLLVYIAVVDWLMGIELGYQVRAGAGLALHHGHGLVVNNGTVLGSGCVLRHGVTLGNRVAGGPCPVLGDHVDVGAHAIVLGGVKLGDGCKIGAGAVILSDVPAGATAVGNPARIIGEKDG